MQNRLGVAYILLHTYHYQFQELQITALGNWRTKMRLAAILVCVCFGCGLVAVSRCENHALGWMRGPAGVWHDMRTEQAPEINKAIDQPGWKTQRSSAVPVSTYLCCWSANIIKYIRLI